MRKRIKITFEIPDPKCWTVRVKENNKEIGCLDNILIILRAGKEPIYLKNVPKAWLESIIENGEIKPINPSSR